MNIITYYAITTAKNSRDVNEWWIMIINLLFNSPIKGSAQVLFEALKQDGLYADDITKMYNHLRSAGLPYL